MTQTVFINSSMLKMQLAILSGSDEIVDRGLIPIFEDIILYCEKKLVLDKEMINSQGFQYVRGQVERCMGARIEEKLCPFANKDLYLEFTIGA